MGGSVHYFIYSWSTPTAFDSSTPSAVHRQHRTVLQMIHTLSTQPTHPHVPVLREEPLEVIRPVFFFKVSSVFGLHMRVCAVRSTGRRGRHHVVPLISQNPSTPALDIHEARTSFHTPDCEPAATRAAAPGPRSPPRRHAPGCGCGSCCVVAGGCMVG